MNWNEIQKRSDEILASGIKGLVNSKTHSFDLIPELAHGNYLISYKGLKYIGEAKNVAIRLKQHSKPNASTFYKNYKKLLKNDFGAPKNLKISDFKFRVSTTLIGRKEMEEFGIVNIPTNLNRFQLGKRGVFTGKVDRSLWGEIQLEWESLLKKGEQSFNRKKSTPWFGSHPLPTAGLYWVEHPKFGLIYIGESSNIQDRWITHSGKTYFSALRRNIAEDVLKFELKVKNGKKKYLTELEDRKVSLFLNKSLVKFLPVSFGRFELEEYLIGKYGPLLNRKDNS
jgi:predicted GIY-YIG superfamily endonuclease